jgi:hypothetical protein
MNPDPTTIKAAIEASRWRCAKDYDRFDAEREPFREALAVAVEALDDTCECQPFRDYTCANCKATAKIDALAGGA